MAAVFGYKIWETKLLTPRQLNAHIDNIAYIIPDVTNEKFGNPPAVVLPTNTVLEMAEKCGVNVPSLIKLKIAGELSKKS